MLVVCIRATLKENTLLLVGGLGINETVHYKWVTVKWGCPETALCCFCVFKFKISTAMFVFSVQDHSTVSH